VIVVVDHCQSANEYTVGGGGGGGDRLRGGESG